MKANIEYMGGIKKGDWEGLNRYVRAALRRCECELDDDRVDEIELFLIEKFWLHGKSIPTRAGKKRDVALKWALREKLKDTHFQNHMISSIQNDDGEEVDIFEHIGKTDDRYKEIEQWHDIAVTIGVKPAKALLFSLYTDIETDKKKEEKEGEKVKQGVLF